jgi:hypothetical protein
MWERSARHNPLSMRYQTYRDHRPFLSQDPTLDWLFGRDTRNNIYYFVFNKKNIICSNNIPVKDRNNMENLIRFQNYILNYSHYVGVISAIFLSKFIFQIRMPYKILYPIIFFGIYKFNTFSIYSYLSIHIDDNLTYYYQKYKHLSVQDVHAIDDPKRKHFRLDTSVYYRQTPQEILHAQHGHHDEGEAHHDTSDYNGPYPYNDFENTDTLSEINKKFTTGTSKFDNPDQEYLIGEKVDVNRFVPEIPTFEDYRNI